MMRRDEEPGGMTTQWSPVSWSGVDISLANRFNLLAEGVCPGCTNLLRRDGDAVGLCSECGVQWSIQGMGPREFQITMRFTVDLRIEPVEQ